KQVFRCQTVAELAAVAGHEVTVEAEQEMLSGDVPLTPIQLWFFEQGLDDASHFNQAALLLASRRLDAESLRKAALALESHHDVVRSRFTREGTGWRQEIAASAPSAFVLRDLSAAAPGDEKAFIEKAAAEIQASLDLEHGPVWRLALLDLGDARPARVLVAAHHLVIDGVSWRVLLEDLETAADQASRGERVRLPRKTTSCRAWAERLRAYAGTAEARS